MSDGSPLWCLQDEAQMQFIKTKYSDRESLLSHATELRKAADKGRLKADGSANPHHARLAIEADMASLTADFAYVMQASVMMQEQVEILSTLYQRVMLLEGAYSHLKQMTDYAKESYKESMKQHYLERKEFLTWKSMVKAGLDPESQSDRLEWEKRTQSAALAFHQPAQENKNEI